MKLIVVLSVILLAADVYSAEALSFGMPAFRKGLGFGRERGADLPKPISDDVAKIISNQDQNMTSKVGITEGASIPNEIFNLVKVRTKRNGEWGIADKYHVVVYLYQ